jgi:hypothetical protein
MAVVCRTPVLTVLFHWGFLQPFTEEESGETIIWDEFVDHQYFLMTRQQKHTIFLKHFHCFVSCVSTQHCTVGLVLQELGIALLV